MAASLSSKIDNLVRIIERMERLFAARNAWVTEEIMMVKTGYNSRKLEKLRRDHPEIMRYRKHGTLDTRGRAVNRDPLYDYEAFLKLHTSPIKD